MANEKIKFFAKSNVKKSYNLSVRWNFSRKFSKLVTEIELLKIDFEIIS